MKLSNVCQTLCYYAFYSQMFKGGKMKFSNVAWVSVHSDNKFGVCCSRDLFFDLDTTFHCEFLPF